MPSIRYIRWSLSLDMLDAIPAGTRSVYPSGLACPGEALDRGQRRASVHRAIEERCRGLCYRWGREPRGEDRFKRDAAMARAARGRIECSRLRPADRPGNTTLHLTTCEVKRHPISNVLFASSRPDLFPSSGHKSSGHLARRGGPVRSIPASARRSASAHCRA